MRKRLLITGAVMAAITVMIGAFGAHALKEILIETGKTETFKTGVLYQMFHSVGLLVLGVMWKSDQKNSLLQIAGYFFLVGIILFSGSLYLLSLGDYSFVGPITPLGGVAFVSGWIASIWHLVKHDD